jgi:succinate-acetate transporter protein
VAAHRQHFGAVAVAFVLLAVTFLLLASETEGLAEAGGRFGLATAVAACYAWFAAVVNSTPSDGRSCPFRSLGH